MKDKYRCEAQLRDMHAKDKHDAQVWRAGVGGHRCYAQARTPAICFCNPAEYCHSAGITPHPPSIYHAVHRDTAEKLAGCFQGLSILEVGPGGGGEESASQ